jgi:hypothetical protein
MQQFSIERMRFGVPNGLLTDPGIVVAQPHGIAIGSSYRQTHRHLPREFMTPSIRQRSRAAAAIVSKRERMARAALGTLVFPIMIVGAYLAKSALGINLLTGPSPLHDLLYHLVR